MKREISIQEYLSVGYIFLIALGIARDAIFYSGMGINVFEYADIVDILLSPIAYLISKGKSLIFFVLMLIAFYKMDSIVNYIKAKGWYKSKSQSIDKAEDSKDHVLPPKVILAAYLIASFFVGTGIGSGFKIKAQLKNQDFEYKDTITFKDNKSKPAKVSIVGQNSNYIFYAERNKKHVSISPIDGNIKKIEHHRKK